MTGLPLAAVELYLEGRGLSQAFPGTVKTRSLPDTEALKRGPRRMLILTRAPGAGLSLEMHVDAPIVTVRTVGQQKDYDDAETFADWVDKAMLSPGSVLVGAYRALYVTRAGGGPAHITTDSSRRAHFSCSYVIPVASGL